MHHAVKIVFVTGVTEKLCSCDTHRVLYECHVLANDGSCEQSLQTFSHVSCSGWFLLQTARRTCYIRRIARMAAN